MNYKILSIDAWANCCGCDHTEESDERCWVWNNWFTIADIEKIPETDSLKIKFLIDEGFLKHGSEKFVHIDDDQYNFVVVETLTGKPLYAFEYGSKLD